MNIIHRIGAALFALAMLLGIVRLAAVSDGGAKDLVCFGIVAALTAPIMLALCSYAFSRGNRD